VVEEHYSDGLSSDARDEASFDRFLSDQTHCPSAPASGRLTTDHSDDSLLLPIIEQSGGAGARFVVKSTVQSALFKPMAHLSDCLGSQRNEPGDLRSTDSIRHLQ